MSNSPRIFVDHEVTSSHVVVSKEDSHHLKTVVRLSAGQTLDIVTPTHCVLATLVAYTHSPIGIEIKATRSTKIVPNAHPITLIQCLPKVDKMAEIIRGVTELGVARIIPVISERCVSIPKDNASSKVDRWRAIAKSAASQSRQSAICTIEPIQKLSTAITQTVSGLKILYWEESTVPIRRLLSPLIPRGPLTIVVGPEGGLSHSEVGLAESQQFVTASLGTTILRVEHAAMVAVAQLNYELSGKE